MKTSRLVASLTAALAVPACFARQIDSSSAGATADHGSEAGPSGNDGVPSGEPPALDPPAGPNDIVGSLWDGLGNRANGASIRVDGAAVATDAWGRFVVRDAPPTYSLVVLGDAPHSGASVFPAATTRTPRVTITSSHIDQPQLASLNVVAPSLSQPDAKLITYVYDPTGYFSVQFDGPSSAIEIKPPNASETVTAYEIEYVQPDSNAPPTAFLRWAKQDGLVMTPGQTTTFTPTMQALTSPAQTVTTHPTTGPGMTVYEAYPYIAPRGATQPPSLFNTWGILTAPAEFSFVIPTIDDLQWSIGYQAYETGQQGSFGGGQSGLLEPVDDDGGTPNPVLPVAPVITSPALNGTFGVGDTITWTSELTACTLSISNDSVGAFIASNSNSAMVPDLSSVGITYASGSSFKTRVNCGKQASPATDADPFFASLDPSVSSYSNVGFTLIAR